MMADLENGFKNKWKDDETLNEGDIVENESSWEDEVYDF